jgi:hypothetical protein
MSRGEEMRPHGVVHGSDGAVQSATSVHDLKAMRGGDSGNPYPGISLQAFSSVPAQGGSVNCPQRYRPSLTANRCVNIHLTRRD